MEEKFQTLLDEAVHFHGHLCGGQVIGVRMAMAALRDLGIQDPKGMLDHAVRDLSWMVHEMVSK